MPDSKKDTTSSSKVSKSRSNSLSTKDNKDKDKDRKKDRDDDKKEDRKEDKKDDKDKKEDKKESSKTTSSSSSSSKAPVTSASVAMAAAAPTASAISTTSSAGGSSRSASKRLLKELSSWEKETRSSSSSSGHEGIERLGPVNEYELLEWEAVINGKGIGAGYDGGRWLLQISIPPNYPLSPPSIAFRTPIVHANVSLQTGEICLDLLKDAWTPAYSILECVKAVRLLLAHPGTDSPLNVDVAALLRAGDRLAAKRLVEFWCQDQSGGRYKGR